VSTGRVLVAALTLSAAGLIGIAVSEGWEPVARPPVPGDVPTGGFGSTRGESGPMRPGERIDPVRGLILLQRDASEAERIVRRCAPVPMHQREFDAFVSLAYNVGPGKAGVKDGFCELKRGGPSTIVRRLRAGDYKGACDAILSWDRFQGKPLRGADAAPPARARGLHHSGAAQTLNTWDAWCWAVSPTNAKLYRNGAQVYSGAHSGLANPAGVSFRCAVGNGLGAPGSNTGGIRAHIDELVIVKGWAGDISGITSEIVL